MGDEGTGGAPVAPGPAQGTLGGWELPGAPASTPAQAPQPAAVAAEQAIKAPEVAGTAPQRAPMPAKPPQSAPAAFSPSKMPDAQQLLDRLKEDILKKGGTWDDRWRVESKMRTSGNTAGTWDSYYFNPEGKRFRSRQEVMKALGMAGDNKKLSREEAVRRAKAVPALQLPLHLEDGIRVNRLGAIDTRPGYHTAMQLWPVGFEAESGGHTGCTLRSSIIDGGSKGPMFTVALLPTDAGQEPAVLASERDPGKAWSRVVALQQAAAAPPKNTPKPSEPCETSAPASASAAPSAVDGGTANGHLSAAERPKEADAADAPAAAPLGQSIKDKLAAAAARPFEQSGGVPSARSGPDQAAPAAPEAVPPLLPIMLPDGRAMPDYIQGLLARMASLSGSWGMEQYGLVDTRVLKALEGLDGADKCSSYKFVEERGTWDAETKRLEKEVLGHSKAKQRAGKLAKKKDQENAERERARQEAQMAKAAKRARDAESKSARAAKTPARDAAAGANGAEPPAKRKKPSQPSAGKVKAAAAEDMLALLHEEPSKRGPQTMEASVARVMRRMLEQVERWAEKDAQKEERQRQKRLEREAAHQERMVQLQKAQEAVAQAPQRLFDIEDSQLPGAKAQPPIPAPVAKGLLPVTTISGVVELWAFLGRFADLLGLDRVPSVAELEADLAAPRGPRSITTSALMQLVQLVATEVFEASLDVAMDADPDLMKVPLSGAQPSIREDTWPEVARRLFLLAAAAELVGAGDGAGGLDIALGPTVGSSPFGALGPSVILPGLIAGPSTLDPRLTPAALPLGACLKAPQAILARQDGLGRAHAAQWLLQSAAEMQDADLVAAEAETLTRTCRRILLRITLVKGPKEASGEQSSGSVFCFEGSAAAVAAKSSQPVDLMAVAARLDAGYYALLGDEGLDAFAADVTAVLNNFRVAAKRSGLEIAARLSERKAADVAELALGTLNSLLEQHRARQTAAAKGSHGIAMVKAKTGGERKEAMAEAGEEDRRERTIVDDLNRPFVPWEGCAACWSNDDHRNILLCDGCDLEYHFYCVMPPLLDIPSGEWFCPACAQEGKSAGQPSGAAAAAFLGPHPAVQTSEFQRAAELLGNTEYSDLSPVQRVGVARLLLSLASSSSIVRDELEHDADKRKALRRELNDIRIKMRREAHERDERDKAEKAALEAAAAVKAEAEGKKKAKGSDKEEIPAALLVDDSVKMTRAREAELAEAARDAERERQILEELDTIGTARAEALGYDRHWNRYWLLGAWEGPRDGVVFVEQRQSGALPREDVRDRGNASADAAEPQDHAACWGCYPSAPAVDQLIAFLNPIGLREGALSRALQKVRPHLAAEPEQQPSKVNAAKSAASVADQHDPKEPASIDAAKDAAASAGQADGEATGDIAAPGSATELGQQPTAAQEGIRPERLVNAESTEADNDAEEKPLPLPKGDPMETDGRAEVTAVPSKAAESKAEPSSELDPRTAEVRKLAGEIMAFEEGPAADALDTGGPTWPYERRRRWRCLLETTTQLPEVKAALILLESALKPERLKPYWMLWSFPAPDPNLAGTVPAVRLRLLALKAALKRGGGGGGGAAREAPATAAAAAPRHGRALRDRGPPAGRVLAEAAAAAATSESEADAPPPPPRKRTRPTQRELADEELARKLQAEENARATRHSKRASRLAAASGPRRSTRAATAAHYSEDDSDSDAPRRGARNAAREGPVDPYRRTRGARAVVGGADEVEESEEEAPPRKTRAALQHLEAARRRASRAAAAAADDSDGTEDDSQPESEEPHGGRPATRVIEGRSRLRKRA